MNKVLVWIRIITPTLSKWQKTDPTKFSKKVIIGYFRRMNSGESIYESLGEEKIKSLVHEFYIQVRQAPDLRKLYPDEDLTDAEERLFLFLLHVFGGPHTYLEKRGHPMLRRRHFQWAIDGKMRNLWLNCMFKAMDKTEMDIPVREQMMSYFIKVANHMINKE